MDNKIIRAIRLHHMFWIIKPLQEDVSLNNIVTNFKAGPSQKHTNSFLRTWTSRCVSFWAAMFHLTHKSCMFRTIKKGMTSKQVIKGWYLWSTQTYVVINTIFKLLKIPKMSYKVFPYIFSRNPILHPTNFMFLLIL